MKVLKKNVLIILIIGIATCYIKSKTTINLTADQKRILAQMDPELPNLARKEDGTAFKYRLNQFGDVFKYINPKNPESIFSGAKETLFELYGLLNSNYENFRKKYYEISPKDKDFDSKVEQLVNDTKKN